MSELVVDAERMHTHATEVRGLGGRADAAADTARQVAFEPDTFGAIGARLVHPFLVPLELAGVLAARASSASYDATAAALDAVADGFELVDQGTSARFGQLLGSLL
ncbi:hypothetical protein [Nocardioides ferulae]|uniref:hypothetical protein n=1 Tax=Nocardioides ferulae TaxID=2340821 RepID=UPI000EB1BB64|nr:hypothetical protein [Nocardioides ferulae]